MAIKAPDLSKTEVFVSSNDPDKGTDKETRFTLRPLDIFAATQLWDSAVQTIPGEEAHKINIHRLTLESVRFALAGWENFLDSEGNAITYETKKVLISGRAYEIVTDEVFAKISYSLVQEIASKSGTLATAVTD